MSRLIFRNDDVNANTDLLKLGELYDILRAYVPSAEIMSCVTVLSKSSPNGAVYPNLPLKSKPFHYFIETDSVILAKYVDGTRIVSHGLWHLDHSKITPDLQEASIVSSCRLLKTDTFVPPFNSWNGQTERICERHGIRLVKHEDGWKSFEHNDFDPSHPLWYFHSWKWNKDSLRAYLNAGVSK